MDRKVLFVALVIPSMSFSQISANAQTKYDLPNSIICISEQSTAFAKSEDWEPRRFLSNKDKYTLNIVPSDIIGTRHYNSKNLDKDGNEFGRCSIGLGGEVIYCGTTARSLSVNIRTMRFVIFENRGYLFDDKNVFGPTLMIGSCHKID